MRVPRAAGAGKGPGMEMVFAVQLALFGPSANFLPEFYALCSPAYFYCTPRLGVAAALPPRAPQNYPPPPQLSHSKFQTDWAARCPMHSQSTTFLVCDPSLLWPGNLVSDSNLASRWHESSNYSSPRNFWWHLHCHDLDWTFTKLIPLRYFLIIIIRSSVYYMTMSKKNRVKLNLWWVGFCLLCD